MQERGYVRRTNSMSWIQSHECSDLLVSFVIVAVTVDFCDTTVGRCHEISFPPTLQLRKLSSDRMDAMTNKLEENGATVSTGGSLLWQLTVRWTSCQGEPRGEWFRRLHRVPRRGRVGGGGAELGQVIRVHSLVGSEEFKTLSQDEGWELLNLNFLTYGSLQIILGSWRRWCPA